MGRYLVILLLFACFGCAAELRFEPAHDRPYKVYNQDKAIVVLLGSLRANGYNVPRASELLPVLDVYWYDTVCPYTGDFALIDSRSGRCHYGYSVGTRVYVSLSNRNPNTTCGSALLHEVAHVAYGDPGHTDFRFWELVAEAHEFSCLRGW